jgi:LacI family transcriptional regulator
MTTSHDIARHVGISQSTVSRALRGDPRVAAATRLRVEQAARDLGYVPNAAARSLITSRTETIAVVLADITNPFFPQLVDVLNDEFGLSGYRTVLLNDRSNATGGTELIPQLSSGSVDGIVFLSSLLTSPVPGIVADRGVPVILLNREVEALDADVVVSDNVGGGALAAESLLKLGHQRIGLIAGPANTSTGRDRERGFLASLQRHGVAFDERLRRESPYSHQGGYQAGTELLTGAGELPTAIFCGNDVIAFGVLDAARRLGIAVPEQMSVIGFDDIEMAGWELFSLTTIRQPLAQMAKAAAAMLLARIGAEQPLEPRRQVFPAGLVSRATTAVVPPPAHS